MRLDVNGSLYPWIAPFVLGMVAGALFSIGNYVPAIICASLAIIARFLHQISIDRGEV